MNEISSPVFEESDLWIRRIRFELKHEKAIYEGTIGSEQKGLHPDSPKKRPFVCSFTHSTELRGSRGSMTALLPSLAMKGDILASEMAFSFSFSSAMVDSCDHRHAFSMECAWEQRTSGSSTSTHIASDRPILPDPVRPGTDDSQRSREIGCPAAFRHTSRAHGGQLHYSRASDVVYPRLARCLDDRASPPVTCPAAPIAGREAPAPTAEAQSRRPQPTTRHARPMVFVHPCPARTAWLKDPACV